MSVPNAAIVLSVLLDYCHNKWRLYMIYACVADTLPANCKTSAIRAIFVYFAQHDNYADVIHSSANSFSSRIYRICCLYYCWWSRRRRCFDFCFFSRGKFEPDVDYVPG